MNALGVTATHGPDRNKQDSGPTMRSPLVASLLFHGFLILLFSGAFFFFAKPIEFPEEPMAVEILPVTDKAQSNFEAPVAPKTPKVPEEVSEEPPPMPKSTAQAQTPTPAKPKPAEKVEADKPKDKPDAPKPLKKADVAEKKAAPIPAKPPKEKPEEAKSEKADEKPVEDTEQFSSVLKNLVGDEEAQPTPDSQPRDTPRQAPQLTAPAPLGSQLSMSEMDMLRQQLAACWNVIAGARDAQNLAVDIEVNVTADKNVLDARVVDQLRYSSDPLFRAAADSALRALRAPACTPLKLPDGKYEQWKNMTINFDPKSMFGG